MGVEGTSDNVTDVVARVKAGEPLVDVEHLTPNELASVIALLKIPADNVWYRCRDFGCRDRVVRAVDPDTPFERAVTSGENYL